MLLFSAMPSKDVRGCDPVGSAISAKPTILAVGDCNTLGTSSLIGSSYPARLSRLLCLEVINRGYTMATTREGLYLLEDSLTERVDCLLIQFGLVDSHRTFQYSPYVLYYPDNFPRKQCRSLVKKYKKFCRQHGLHKRFGEKHVVDEQEYASNIKQMVLRAGEIKVFLLDTIPTSRTERNKDIVRYNAILSCIAEKFPTCSKVDLYEDFVTRFDEFSLDGIHCSASGHDFIARKIHTLLAHDEL